MRNAGLRPPAMSKIQRATASFANSRTNGGSGSVPAYFTNSPTKCILR